MPIPIPIESQILALMRAGLGHEDIVVRLKLTSIFEKRRAKEIVLGLGVDPYPVNYSIWQAAR